MIRSVDDLARDSMAPIQLTMSAIEHMSPS
jgi:hypothetical protein